MICSYIVAIVLNLTYNKKKFYKTLENWSGDILKFDLSEKGLGLISPQHFVYEFPRKNASHVIFY